MENHLFLWLRNRTTDNRKCEKARNIKEKRTIEMFSTASKPLVALRSSASAEFLFQSYTAYKCPNGLGRSGVSYALAFCDVLGGIASCRGCSSNSPGDLGNRCTLSGGQRRPPLRVR